MSRERSEVELARLGQFESPNVTFVDPERRWPIVWDRGEDCWVWDVDGKRYLDLTAAFGVAALGHTAPHIVRAGQQQLAKLPHAMGDVHPHPLKGILAQKLSSITFERWTQGRTKGRTIFGSSGFEAVEAALKTARMATGRNRIIAFEGGYHGLGYGALNATHRQMFRQPFRKQLAEFADFVPFPTTREIAQRSLEKIRDHLSRREVGAVLMEPIQARGGIRVPPSNFLSELTRVLQDHGALLILDEVYTGFGRTGRWFACEWEPAVPDLICLGKALTGGFPLSAMVGKADLVEAAWPPSNGEAIHTSTFLGNPVGCAMAIAQIEELIQGPWIESVCSKGDWLQQRLNSSSLTDKGARSVRGRGLMVGVDYQSEGTERGTHRCLNLMYQGLDSGIILLPEGERADVLGMTPPLTITKEALDGAIQSLEQVDRQTQ